MEDQQRLNDYERARALVIARNRARLEAIGVHVAVQELQKAVKSDFEEKSGRKHVDRKRKQRASAQPQRRSKRLHAPVHDGSGSDGGAPDADAAVLANFIINGECPRCGKVITRGHRKHLDMCNGSLAGSEHKDSVDMALADLVALEVKRIESEDNKLKALEVGGLVDLTEVGAVFMVVGSTGRHYEVKLEDGDGGAGKSSCQCLDARMRKHRCKHQRLILSTLGIEGNIADWRSAARRLVESQPQRESGGAEEGKVH